MSEAAEKLARILYEHFVEFHEHFLDITHRARDRFLTRDWSGHQSDVSERLRLHTSAVLATVETCRDQVDPADDGSREAWKAAQLVYVNLVSDRMDLELAETFYNSVTRRLFGVVGLDRELEFIWLGPTALPADDGTRGEYRIFPVEGSTSETLREIMDHSPLSRHFANADRDAKLVADRVDSHLEGAWRGLDAIDVLRPIFYRNKGAYLVGRLRWLNRLAPCIIPVVHDRDGVHVDAVLLTETDTSRLFGYTRSYFHALCRRPAAVVGFLKSMLPVKPVAELYTSIGYSQHGKTNLFRALFRHMEHSNTRFERSRGARGLVMAVFALPSFDVVFKVIKDRFGPTKRTTPTDVKRRYDLVFAHDRVGRLVDAQEFENISFARDRFDEDLIDELLRECSRSITVTADEVVLSHVYTERRVYPLDLYLREMSPERAHDAAIDYGNAIKDLAAANIFPGDLFPKNFGVTRHGTVVFYDYDELTLLSDANFRTMPQVDDYDDAMQEEPWFGVTANDVFPEEFRTYLRSPRIVAEVFSRHHPEITTVEFWKAMQDKHGKGELPDFFPYPKHLRVR